MKPILLASILLSVLLFAPQAFADSPVQGPYGEWTVVEETYSAPESIGNTETPNPGTEDISQPASPVSIEAPKRVLKNAEAIHKLQAEVAESGNLPMCDDWYAAMAALESEEETVTTR